MDLLKSRINKVIVKTIAEGNAPTIDEMVDAFMSEHSKMALQHEKQLAHMVLEDIFRERIEKDGLNDSNGSEPPE